VSRGRIDATRAAVARWAGRFDGREVHVAVEACTGWLFVCDALVGVGAVAHLAEPVETRALRGRKRRAKTDREDARWLRELLADGRLPEAWIAPEHVRQWCSRARLRHTLIDERTQWLQRIQATLFHHGISGMPEKLRTRAGRVFLEVLELRLSASRKAVRIAGIDIGVHRSDRRSRVGKLNRQGSPQLRWALYEAALAACRPSSPDHADYLALKARGLSHTRASLTIARKLARRSFHMLRELGPAALEPIPTA
jgi:transposase